MRTVTIVVGKTEFIFGVDDRGGKIQLLSKKEIALSAGTGANYVGRRKDRYCVALRRAAKIFNSSISKRR